MRLRVAAVLLVSLAACGDGGDVCAARHENYRVHATLSMREPGKSASENGADASQLSGKLSVSVTPDRAITSCRDGVVSETTPALSLLDTKLEMRDGTFTVDVPSTTYPAIYTPALWLGVHLDENGNGRCDDGEPAGGVELTRAEHAEVHLELVRAACDLPRL
jgi:hypothetical protein